MTDMTATTTNGKCSGADCANEAGTLQCPTCLKKGLQYSLFCSQDCFNRNWNEHKILHKPSRDAAQQNGIGHYNPFPNYAFTGPIRPVYPLSPRRLVPAHISRPDWADDGIPRSENRLSRTKIELLDARGQDAMRVVCRLAREVLDVVAAEVRPGVTTDYLDEVCHRACIERDAYPSPLNYNHFPKSLCTSPNEVACHGIPDHRALVAGDIVNLDISLYHGGHHADVNETYYVTDDRESAPFADADSIRLVETTRECLAKAIALVAPNTPIRALGAAIEKHAKSRGCAVVPTWGGHGINTHFHPPPWIPHYARNKAVGVCRPGMAFTIEPILSLGDGRDGCWPDGWTSVALDGRRTAQFEHTLLVTETGVEVLTARTGDSPGGPVPMPVTMSADGC